jgi:conjugation transfer TcpE-like protein
MRSAPVSLSIGIVGLPSVRKIDLVQRADQGGGVASNYPFATIEPSVGVVGIPDQLPVGQIAVFAAITAPYIVHLGLFGLPSNQLLFWLYVLPPGLLTWPATRPVLESKRLPELIISQAAYMGEPSTWCRLAPLAERDEIAVFGWVWRHQRSSAVTAKQEGLCNAKRPGF